MPFGIIGRTGAGMRQVVRFGDWSTGRGTFGGKIGARYCNQWGLYFTCVYVCDSAAMRPSSQIALGRLVICCSRKSSFGSNSELQVNSVLSVFIISTLLSIKTRDASRHSQAVACAHHGDAEFAGVESAGEGKLWKHFNNLLLNVLNVNSERHCCTKAG